MDGSKKYEIIFVLFCFREVVIRIGKLKEKFDDVFLTDYLCEKVVVEVVGMLSTF